MINKNKFSIKDTKKVLHKVGKRWVVVSAVLLGLAAGGAAVTNANADTTQAVAQPTAAQQVAKNANMSSANHSFGTADPVNTTKAPASGNGINNVSGLNSIKSDVKNKLANHNLPSNVSGMKSYAKSKASSADVNHLTDLANLARANGQQNAYSDLINLANNGKEANNKDHFDNITVGSDTTSNFDSDTLFGILNRASRDVNAINSGASSNSTVSKVAHYLSDAQKLANSNVSHAFTASQLSSAVAQAGAGSLSTEVTVPGSSSSINLTSTLDKYLPSSLSSYFNNLSMTASVGSTTASVAPSYTLSLNVSSVVNNGINVSSAVSSAVNGSNGIVTKASNSIQSQASGIATSLDGQILSQLGNSNSGVIASLNSDILTAEKFTVKNVKDSINDYLNYMGFNDTALNNELSNHNAEAKKLLGSSKYSALSAANNILQSTSNPNVSSNLSVINSNISSISPKTNKLSSASSIVNTINTLNISNIDSNVTTDVEVELSGSDSANGINSLVDPITGSKTNSAGYNINKAISSAASSDFASKIHGSTIASKITNKLYSMGIGGPNKLFGPFTSDAISPAAAANFLTSNNSANANVASSLLSQFNVPNASGKVNKVIGLLNKANKRLGEFNGSPANNYYNNLVSTAANLTNTDTNYPNAHSAYIAIASDASNLNRELTEASEMHFNIPKYSDISAYAKNQIVSEANSSANSMETTSAIMFNTLSEAKADNNSSLENTLLSSVINKLSSASASYNSGLTGQDTSESLDHETINFMDGNTSVSASNVTGTPNETFNAQSLSAPSGYSLASDATDNATITINNGSANVDVVSTNTPESGGGYVPFIPSFNNGSSVNTYYEPSTVSGNVEPTVRYANYVLVTKALQLHTNPNFTKRNGVAVIKPGVVLNVEKTVRARHNLIRYEVRYNNKNYFVTANKHFGVYDRYELAKPSHYRYAKVDTALQLHQSTNFTKKNGVKVVKPGTEFRINRVVKSNKGVTRYEVNYKGSVYFITASSHYVENAYLQKSNFSKRGHKAVRAAKPVNEYRHVHFSKRGLVRHFRRGTVLPVRRVFTIGKGEITRLQLTNGRYVSANKDFVRAIR